MSVLFFGCTPQEVEQTNETLTVYIDNASKFKLNMAVSLYKTKYPDVDVIVQIESESSDMETLNQKREQLSTELISGEGCSNLYQLYQAPCQKNFRVGK